MATNQIARDEHSVKECEKAGTVNKMWKKPTKNCYFLVLPLRLASCLSASLFSVYALSACQENVSPTRNINNIYDREKNEARDICACWFVIFFRFLFHNFRCCCYIRTNKRWKHTMFFTNRLVNNKKMWQIICFCFFSSYRSFRCYRFLFSIQIYANTCLSTIWNLWSCEMNSVVKFRRTIS